MKPYRAAIHVSLAVIALVLFFGASKGYSGQQEGKAVRFRWAFAATKKGEHDSRVIPITHEITLKKGDQLKMLVELEARCFVYVIYQNPQDGLYMLFPYDLKQFDAKAYELGKPYYIPQGDGWFELDEHTGQEVFYLLASAQQLVDLEELFERYRCSEQCEKQVLGERILKRIHEEKRSHRRLTTTAERPLTIGGSVRGSGTAALPDIATIATEIEADTFFSRTFTIDHR
jgi:hypothetical protein